MLGCGVSLKIAIVGKVVSGYKVHRDSQEVDHWTLLGRRNPLTPQMFYPVFNKDPVSYGDKLVYIQIVAIHTFLFKVICF